MIEIEQCCRFSETSPVMVPPLVNHLHFDGMTEYGNIIILGIEADIPDLDPHTRRYINEIATTIHYIHDQAQPISLEY